VVPKHQPQAKLSKGVLRRWSALWSGAADASTPQTAIDFCTIFWTVEGKSEKPSCDAEVPFCAF